MWNVSSYCYSYSDKFWLQEFGVYLRKDSIKLMSRSQPGFQPHRNIESHKLLPYSLGISVLSSREIPETDYFPPVFLPGLRLMAKKKYILPLPLAPEQIIQPVCADSAKKVCCSKHKPGIRYFPVKSKGVTNRMPICLQGCHHGSAAECIYWLVVQNSLFCL